MSNIENLKKRNKELEKTIKFLEEYYAYLHVQPLPKKKLCEHKIVKMTEFTKVENLEIAEIYCLTCYEYLGIAYRKVKVIKQEKVNLRIILSTKNKNYYIFKEK